MGDINIRPEVLDIRWNAFEKKRKEKVKAVMDERRVVIDQMSNKNGNYYIFGLILWGYVHWGYSEFSYLSNCNG